MRTLLHNRSFHIALAILVIGAVIAMMLGVGQRDSNQLVTTVVERGDVRQLVSVSGVAEAEQSAELAFPVTGIVARVLVEEGDVVEAGDILIELDSRALQADRQDALAALNQARANRDELLAGPTATARDATAESITLKQEALETTIENENRKVENARQNLLSNDLTAYSDAQSVDAPAPVISGTYTCDEEGEYLLEVFNSGTASGYSFRLSGLETGTYAVSVDRPVALGSCGLRAQFSAGEKYNLTTWYIEIPNTKSSSYVSARNAYALAQTQAASAIALAEQDLTLTEANATDTNAPARNEAVVRADASVEQARARLARIDATIADRVLVAPFSGTVTEIDVLPGETVTTVPVVNLLASSEFEVTARIPEIDIGKLQVGQSVEMVFDARSGETLEGEVSFISLKATEIDGVAYYKAIIELAEVPDWIRSGLNADIDIIIEERVDVLRVPKRFLVETESGFEVIKRAGDQNATSTVTLELEGNDGFVAIAGVNSGDVLVAP